MAWRLARSLWLGGLVILGCTEQRKTQTSPGGMPKPTVTATPDGGGTALPQETPAAGGTLHLEGIQAVGRAGEAGIATTGSDVLVGMSGSGLVPLLLSTGNAVGLTAEGSASPASVGCVLGLGTAGVALQAKQRISEAPFFVSSDLARLAVDGRIIPFVPDSSFSGLARDVPCDVALQASADGFLYALEADRKAIWRFSLSDATGTRTVKLETAEAISRFTPLAGGHVLFSTTEGESTRRSWWRTPEGAVVSLQYPNVDIAQSKTLGATALTFSSGGRSGAMLLSPLGSGLERSFVEPLYGTGTMTYWGAASRIAVGDWLVTGYTALNPKGGKLASNPFWRSYGRFQGLVDADRQTYFDGSNLVNVSHDDKAGLRVSHAQNILQNALEKWKVVAVFGPAQGFADKWVGFANDAGFIPSEQTPHLYWVEIDPTTGRVDDTKVYRMLAPHMASGSPDLIPEFTPYRVPGQGGTSRIVGLGGTLAAGLFELAFDETAKTVTLGPQMGCAYTYEHGRALLHEHRLLFTASWYDWDPGNPEGCVLAPQNLRSVYFYDGDTHTAATESTRISLPAEVGDILTPPEGGRTCNAHETYGLLFMPGRSGPSMLVCDVRNQDTTARTAQLRLLHFTDFSFSQLDSQVPLPASVGLDDDSQGDFATGTVNNTDWMQSFALPGNVLALGFGRTRAVRLVDTTTGSTKTTVPFNELWTENRFEYSRIFGHMSNLSWSANEVNVVAEWDSTRFFASDDTDAGYRSYLVNIADRTFAPLADLDGMEVTSAVRVSAERVLVSAQEGTSAVTLLLDNDGRRVDSSSAKWVVREVAPLVR